MQRWLSFRFDDGMMQGSQKAARLLEPDAASFFLITDFVSDPSEPGGTLPKDGDYGSLERWRRLAAAGHDIQAHSASHANFHDLDVEAQVSEATRSLAFVRRVHPGPYVFCAPFNRLPTVDLAAVGYDAAGFVTLSSDQPIIFNRPAEPELDRFRLRSWAARERHGDAVVDQLAGVPDGAWVILAFHSLDGEGWEPWSSEGLARLIAAVRGLGYTIRSVGAVIADLKMRR